MWISARTDDPRHRCQTHVERVERIGNLRGGDVHCRSWIPIESVAPNIAYNADNLSRSFSRKLGHDNSFSDPNLIAQRIGLRPKLFRHRLIDDDDRVRAAVVTFRECTAPHYRDPEDVEIAR